MVHIPLFAEITDISLISPDIHGSPLPLRIPRQSVKRLFEQKISPLDGTATSVEHGVHMPDPGSTKR